MKKYGDRTSYIYLLSWIMFHEPRQRKLKALRNPSALPEELKRAWAKEVLPLHYHREDSTIRSMAQCRAVHMAYNLTAAYLILAKMRGKNHIDPEKLGPVRDLGFPEDARGQTPVIDDYKFLVKEHEICIGLRKAPPSTNLLEKRRRYGY